MGESGTKAARGAFLVIALSCLAVSSSYVVSMLALTGGHFVPQVSDLYLIAQYAKGFAEGHPFQYNPGEAPTTGATSLLHTAFLGLAHAVGFRGEGLIAFAILSGAIFSFLAATQAYRAGRTLSAREPVALLGALLVILNGPLAWSFHYGADIALVLFLSAWLFAAWIERGPDSEAETRYVLPACLLAMTRPEAAILVTGLGLSALWETRGRKGQWIQKAKFLLPSVTAVLVLLLLRAFTGAAANTSFSRKLLSENWGVYNASAISVDYWTDVLRGLLLGFYPSSERLGLGSGYSPFYAPPLLLLFVFLALLRKTPVTERALTFLGASLVTALAITPTIHIGFHFNRYLLFALPPLLVLMSVGLEAAATLMALPLNASSELTFRRLGLTALAFGVLSVTRFGLIYGDWAASVYQRDEAVISFINQRLPKDATFLNNGTAIEYRTGRRSLNLSGVVSPDFASILPTETEASAFEVLSRRSRDDLPPFFIAPENYAAESGLRILIAGPPIFVTSSLQPSELAIYPTRNDLVGRQRDLVRAEVPPELALTDSVNLGDPLDERAHNYRFHSSAGTQSLYATLKLDTYEGDGRGSSTEIADGGRVLFGFEEFEVASPGQGELWIVMRTSPTPAAHLQYAERGRRVEFQMKENRVRFSTSRGATSWLTTPLEPGWNEVTYRVPASLVEPQVTRLRLEGRWSSFGYWVFRRPK